MTTAFVDTHVVLWLYAGQAKLLSARARRAIERMELVASPASKLELGYLHELGRIGVAPQLMLDDLFHRVGLTVKREDFGRIVEQALELSWTRDVFDRMIVAHAAVDASALITKDRTIQKHYANAVW